MKYDRIFHIAQSVPALFLQVKRHRKSICSHSEMASKWLQMLIGIRLEYKEQCCKSERMAMPEGRR